MNSGCKYTKTNNQTCLKRKRNSYEDVNKFLCNLCVIMGNLYVYVHETKSGYLHHL